MQILIYYRQLLHKEDAHDNAVCLVYRCGAIVGARMFGNLCAYIYCGKDFAKYI